MGELMCAVGRGPRAGELRGRRGALGRAGPGRPRLRRAGRRTRPGATVGVTSARARSSTRCRSTPRAAGSTPRAGRAGARPPGTRSAATRPRPDEEWQHLMRFRPGTPVAADGVQAEGLLVVDPGTGEPARLLRRRTDPRRCRPCARSSRATASSSAPPGRSTSTHQHADGGEAALAAFGDAYAAARRTAARAPPTVWCSWYRYFEQVTAGRHRWRTCAAFDEHDLRRGRRADRRRLEPRSRRGAAPAPAVRVAARPGGRDPRPRAAGRAVAGAVPRRGADHAGPGAPRLAGRPRRPQLGPGPRRPGPHPPRRAGPAARRSCGGWWRSAWTTSSSTSSTPARCPARGTTTSTRWRPTARGWRWSARTVGPDVYLVGCGAPLLPERGAGGRDAGLARHLPRGRRGRLRRAARADAAGGPGLAAGPALGQRPRLRGGPAVVLACASGGPTRRGRSAGCASFSDRVAELDELGPGDGARAAGRGRHRRAVCRRTGPRRRPSSPGPRASA